MDYNKSEKKTIAEVVVNTLAKKNVKHVFGIAGVHNIDFFDVLLDHPEIKLIVPRHEQGAVFMADGYSRAGGGIGVAFVITGPGVTNSLTGIAQAYSDSSSVALIATEINEDFIGQERGFIHELRDQIGMVKNIVKHSVRICSDTEVKKTVSRILSNAIVGRKRPIYIEIPFDSLSRNAKIDHSKITEETGNPNVKIDMNDIHEVVSLIEQAKRPLIYIGGGVQSEETSKLLKLLAEKMGAPVISTVKGKGAISGKHPLYIGVSWAKEIMESEIMKDADLVLALGTRLSARLKYGNYGSFKMPDNLIHVDIDTAVIGQNFKTEIGINADVNDVLPLLIEQIKIEEKKILLGFKRAEQFKERLENTILNKDPVIIQSLLDLRNVLPEDSIIVGDNSLYGIWAARYFPVYRPRSFLFPMGYGTLGFGLPAAIGAKIAQPDKTVISISGDGGFMFSLQELSVAIEQNINLSVIIINDNKYGSVYYNQKNKFGRVSGTELINPDFKLLANSFGCNYYFVQNPAEIKKTVKHSISNIGVNIIEVEGSFVDWY